MKTHSTDIAERHIKDRRPRSIFFVLILSALLFIPLCLSAQTSYEKATFAGGCFWCMEHPFEKLKGVVDVSSGYTGGHKENPTYKAVSYGETSHLEAVQITYDRSVITYDELLKVFWRQINPTDSGGQFVDRGEQYTTSHLLSQ